MTKRICSTCKEEKNLFEFRKDKSSSSGYQSYCAQCARNYHKSTYMGVYGDKSRKRSRDNHTKNKALLVKYKQEKACEKCGEKHPACLQFHHRVPAEKKNEVSAMMTSYIWERVLEEIKKCMLICANCHAKIHWEEKN